MGTMPENGARGEDDRDAPIWQTRLQQPTDVKLIEVLTGFKYIGEQI